MRRPSCRTAGGTDAGAAPETSGNPPRCTFPSGSLSKSRRPPPSRPSRKENKEPVEHHIDESSKQAAPHGEFRSTVQTQGEHGDRRPQRKEHRRGEPDEIIHHHRQQTFGRAEPIGRPLRKSMTAPTKGRATAVTKSSAWVTFTRAMRALPLERQRDAVIELPIPTIRPKPVSTISSGTQILTAAIPSLPTPCPIKMPSIVVTADTPNMPSRVGKIPARTRPKSSRYPIQSSSVSYCNISVGKTPAAPPQREVPNKPIGSTQPSYPAPPPSDEDYKTSCFRYVAAKMGQIIRTSKPSSDPGRRTAGRVFDT